jgi:hypothetical protein
VFRGDLFEVFERSEGDPGGSLMREIGSRKKETAPNQTIQSGGGTLGVLIAAPLNPQLPLGFDL